MLKSAKNTDDFAYLLQLPPLNVSLPEIEIFSGRKEDLNHGWLVPSPDSYYG